MSVQAFYRFGGFVQFLQSLDRPFIDLAYDHIVENLSNVLMCRNCKVTYKVKLLAMTLGIAWRRVLSFSNSRMVKYY